MGTIYVVATPIGNLSDISKRALDIFNNVDLILAEDTRHSIKLLNYYKINKKMISYHKFNENKRSIEIINKILNDNIDVALITDAGTPCISDPGYILIKEARGNNINIIGIPGPSALITALSVSGIDSSSFSFYGFVPKESKYKKKLFNDIKSSNIKTSILYESPKRIIKLLEDLKQEFNNLTICVCSDLTKIHEESVYGNINDVLNKLKGDISTEKGEYTVIIYNPNDIIVDTNESSLEALIIDYMIKNNVSMKEALNNIKQNKNKLYKASLNIKNILNK
ncbi:MAG TPA: 16S rRNA (cytidine(1402)-2'-O)-methyltransferase [Bacilli bacterium]|nr:16S rRNA (cytidine(1402)-2'-O)-methyltransferase [Bacilli bacterium]